MQMECAGVVCEYMHCIITIHNNHLNTSMVLVVSVMKSRKDPTATINFQAFSALNWPEHEQMKFG